MNLLELQIPNLERVLGSRQGGNKTCVQSVTIHTHSRVVYFDVQILHLKITYLPGHRPDFKVIELSHAHPHLGIGRGVVPIYNLPAPS